MLAVGVAWLLEIRHGAGPRAEAARTPATVAPRGVTPHGVVRQKPESAVDSDTPAQPHNEGEQAEAAGAEPVMPRRVSPGFVADPGF
jgi:hypothetical protein